MASCASRNGTPRRARRSAASVASEKSAMAASAMRSESPAGGADHRRQHVERRQHGVDRVEERLFVFLKVLVVGERQPLGDGEHGDQVAIDAAGLAPRQLGDVRVLLLRHDRASGGEGVGELEEAELGRRPEDDLLRQPREMHRDHGSRRRARRARSRGRRRRRGCSRRWRRSRGRTGRLAVDRVGHAGEGARAERHDVGPAIGVSRRSRSRSQHGDVGKQMMCQEDRLGALQVGVAGHDHVSVGGRRLGQARRPGRARRSSAPGAPLSSRAAGRSRPGRCGSGRCAACRRPGRRARAAAARRRCGRPRRRSVSVKSPASTSARTCQSPRSIAAASSAVDDPLLAEHAGVGDRARGYPRGPGARRTRPRR